MTPLFHDVIAYDRAVTNIVGARIKLECRALRVRQHELAELIGVDKQTLSRKVNNQGILRLGELYTIADVLDLHPTDLLPTYGDLRRIKERRIKERKYR